MHLAIYGIEKNRKYEMKIKAYNRGKWKCERCLGL